MDIKPQNFEDHSRLLAKNNKQWIKRLTAAKGQGKYDIVVDIGCGTGYTTQQLVSDLNVGHIYGIDVDKEMIEFAKQNHSKESISYSEQDFGVEFDSMSSEVKALEGKVSLILSINCLQFILDEKTVAKNLKRLLSKGGIIYVQFVHVFDPYSDLTAEEKAIHEKEFMKIPDIKTVFNDWSTVLKSVGFNVINAEIMEEIVYISREHCNRLLIPLLVANLRRYLTDSSDVNKVQQKCNEIESKISTTFKEFKDEITGEVMVNYHRNGMYFILDK